MISISPLPSLAAATLLKNTRLWWLGMPLLVLGLILYCELWSILTHRPAAGLAVSGGWALRTAFGWIVAVAALQHFSSRVATSRMASIHPWTTAVACVAGIATFTLTCEWLMSERWPTIFSFLYARAPMHLAVTALLVALFAKLRAPTPRTSAPAAPGILTAPEPVSASIEVMTGTGHTTIRVDDIEWLKAERNYINVMHRSGRTFLLRKTMAALEESLDAQSFARVHRSIIVNRSFVRERRAGGILVLHSGTTLRMSRAYRDALSQGDR